TRGPSRQNRTSRNKTERSEISNDSSNKTSQINTSNKLPNSNKIRSDDSNSNGKTILRMIGRKLSSNNSIRIAKTGQQSNEVHLRRSGSRLPGRAIARVAGSPSTVPGNNAAVTRDTMFQMTVSAPVTAGITASASIVYPWCLLAAVSAFTTAAIGSV